MITIKKKKGANESMNIEEFTRWMCLMEALCFIVDKAKELKIDVDAIMKPMAIDEYIKERYSSMLHDVQCEHRLGNI